MIEIGFVDTLLHPTYSLTTKGDHEISGFGLQCYLEKGPRDRFPFSYLGECDFGNLNHTTQKYTYYILRGYQPGRT